jgi:phage terminase large subunit-like protein
LGNCLALAGRGFGKTWMGARWAITKAREGKTIGALVGPTAADVRDTMIRGSSGILALSPPWFMPVYEPSKRRVTGRTASTRSATRPTSPTDCAVRTRDGCGATSPRVEARDGGARSDPALQPHRQRSPAAADAAHRDAPAAEEARGSDQEATTVLVTGSSLANAANLAPTTVANMRNLANTRWGKQEVLGLLLMDVPGAIFGSAKWGRVDADPVAYGMTLDRRIVAVDPAPTSETGSDEWGIIVEGVKNSALFGPDGMPLKRVSILADRSDSRLAARVARAPRSGLPRVRRDTLVCEVNSGGEMVETIIQTVAAELGVT